MWEKSSLKKRFEMLYNQKCLKYNYPEHLGFYVTIQSYGDTKNLLKQKYQKSRVEFWNWFQAILCQPFYGNSGNLAFSLALFSKFGAIVENLLDRTLRYHLFLQPILSEWFEGELTPPGEVSIFQGGIGKRVFLRHRRRSENFLSTFFEIWKFLFTFFEIFGKFVNKNAIKSDSRGVVGK